ncbi:DUF6644 family protein [Roseateles amylovorans]|uniref:DUF6644 domain-containing protein n=1 Tax=Roseateles amylovorans TaxID=2978473 RepID=A0ABY6AVA1_9BURK|nr:DUF6644 family protein [Roseateles amylovorans]UXH76607.1 hypothetical protein N4261_16345 [Roseateles amylovorans]
MLAQLVSHPWAYPAYEVVHLIGLGALFGGLLVFELRTLGVRPEVDPGALARLAIPTALAGFALCLISGAAMFATQPQELWINGALRVKMALILLAGLNAAWFHRRGGVRAQDRLGRAQCLLSLVLWIAVIICGRWIAYV